MTHRNHEVQLDTLKCNVHVDEGEVSIDKIVVAKCEAVFEPMVSESGTAIASGNIEVMCVHVEVTHLCLINVRVWENIEVQ